MALKILYKINDKKNSHNGEISALCFNADKIYSGADDGIIKIWRSSDLKYLSEINAHPNAVINNIVIIDNKIYSCSSDCTIKTWDLNTLQPISTIYKSDKDAVQKLFVANDGTLYSGDEKGLVHIWKNDKIIASTETAEEIRDMMVIDNNLFTIRDTDLVITEIIPGTKYNFKIKNVLECARAPMCTAFDKLLYVGKSGRDIFVRENKPESSFPEIGYITQAHKMIINCICGYGKDSAAILFSGGWDNYVTKWKISGISKPEKTVCNLDTGVNAMALDVNKEILYIGGSEGKIIAIKC